MPLMTKIRENLATFFSVFAGLFVVYIVLDWGMDITGRKQSKMMTESQEIGRVNDKAILAKDFAERLRQALESQKQQSGSEPDEDQQRTIREQIWNAVVEQMLFAEEMDRLGIKVTDQEIYDWVYGDNPPEILRRQFTDSTGVFNREQYTSALRDPRNKEQAKAVEDFLRLQRQREKLQSVLLASVQVDEGELRQRFADQNQKYTVEYVLFDPNVFVKDTELTVSDDDLRRFYNEHSDEFKVEASRKLKYVSFPDVASNSDTAAILGDLVDILRRSREGTPFEDLQRTYSETPASDAFIKHGELDPEREAAVYGASPGDILGPLKSADGYHIMKVLEFRPGTEEFLHASHILIQIQNNDSVTALRDARAILAQVKGGADFAEVARTTSKDPGSGSRGGDLGWFGKGKMVKPFEDAAMAAKPGQIVGPVRSPFGYHIIKVHAKDKREVKILDLKLSIRPSSQTRTEVSQRAQDFAYVSRKESFEKVAQQLDYRILETQSFQKDAVIPGFGLNQALNKFAFTNKTGTISEPFFTNNSYAVFMVSEVKDAGVRPLEEVRQVVEGRLKRQLRTERTAAIARQMRQEIKDGDSLGVLVAKNPSLAANRLTDITLAGFIPGIGRDAGLVGGISALTSDRISQPVEGTRGVYLLRLLSKTPFDSTGFQAQREGLRTQLLSEKRSRAYQEWSQQLKKNANILDKRDLFYR